MFWVFFFLRHRSHFNTGPIERYLTFVCERCRAATAMHARTVGVATARNQQEAMRAAHMNAEANIAAASTAAACPHCGALSSASIEFRRRAIERIAQRQKLRKTAPLAVTIVAAIAIAIPAALDFRHSFGLAILAASAPLALGGFLLGYLSGPIGVPQTEPTGLSFSFDPSQGPSSWFPARGAVNVEPITQPPQSTQHFAYAVMTLSAFAAIAGLVIWRKSFQDIYVVSSEPALASALVVEIDGQHVGSTSMNEREVDIAIFKKEVRTSSVHHVVVRAAAPTPDAAPVVSYDLQPSDHGWVIAPRARANGLCLTKITTYYNRKPEPGGNEVLNDAAGDGDLIELPKRFDFYFKPSPRVIETKNGSETRTALRALDCAALVEDGDIVPFKSRDASSTTPKHPAAPATPTTKTPEPSAD
jgi:hypothetical protein